MNRPNNSKECIYEGYKLSTLSHDISHSDNVEAIWIGCEGDASFYQQDDKAGRVQIIVCLINGEEAYIDLEDILNAAKQSCNGIYERIYQDVK